MTMEYNYWPAPAVKTTGSAGATDSRLPASFLSPAETDEQESFTFYALMIHAWLKDLLDEAVQDYARKPTGKYSGMQTGQAHRRFLSIFGHLNDAEFQRLSQNMYRFTTCNDPLAVILFRALDALSIEHESAGDFVGTRAPDASERPRESLRWMRESMDRWFEWVDAFVHVQTHAQWHLAPERFQSDPARRRSMAGDFSRSHLENLRAVHQSDWQVAHSDTSRFYRELPLWQLLPQPVLSQPQRPWPHPELDEAILSLWPLVKRHHWTFGDLLTVLRDLRDDSEAYPCQSERNLAMYCLHTLRLRKTVTGKTAKRDRPNGYHVAVRLFPPLPPRPVFLSNVPDGDDDDIIIDWE
jgi:hypothetical protein